MNRTVTRLLALVLLLCPFAMMAQEKLTVTGTVVDSYEEPLIGVSVLVKGSGGTGMSTNIDGEFSIKAAVGDILQFSYIGFTPQEVKVNVPSALTTLSLKKTPRYLTR